jgi:Flp pilus assembly pilin Flp
MNKTLRKLSAFLKNLAKEEGQDLVEYAFVVALIAFSAVGAMHTLATSINGSFTKINAALTSSIT